MEPFQWGMIGIIAGEMIALGVVTALKRRKDRQLNYTLSITTDQLNALSATTTDLSNSIETYSQKLAAAQQAVSAARQARPPFIPLPQFMTTQYVLAWRYHNNLERGSYGGHWDKGQMDAECMLNNHPVPTLHCSCGIYAYKDESQISQGYHTALVAMSGTILEYSEGYRAECVQVVAFAPSTLSTMEEDLWSPLGITRCKSRKKLLRVHDFYMKNPDALYDEVERLSLERMYATTAIEKGKS